MNRHFRTFLLVLGGVTLVAGSAIFAVGCKTVKNTGKTREFDLSDKVFTSFEFDCDTSDIEFIASTDMKIVYQETEKIYHTEEVKDGTLFIKQTDDLKWYERVFTFDFSPKKATIYLPAGHYASLKADNNTGDIKITHDFSFDAVDIKLSTGDVDLKSDVIGDTKVVTSTGNISLSDMSTKSLTVDRSTGNLKLNKLNVTEAIVVEGSTGKFSATEVKAASLKVNQSTGDVNLKDVKVTGALDIKCSTGDVEFDDIDFATGNIKTSTGDIEGTLSTPKYVEASSDTGKVKVDSDRMATQTLTVKSDTGKIIISNK